MFACKYSKVFNPVAKNTNKPTSSWHFLSASVKIKSLATAFAELQYHQKQFRVEISNEACCVLGKTGRAGLQTVRYFKERIS